MHLCIYASLHMYTYNYGFHRSGPPTAHLSGLLAFLHYLHWVPLSSRCPSPTHSKTAQRSAWSHPEGEGLRVAWSWLICLYRVWVVAVLLDLGTSWNHFRFTEEIILKSMDWFGTFYVQLQQNKDFTFLGGSYCTCSLQHILGCNDLASKVRPSWHGCLQTCRAASVAERTWKDHKIPPAKPSPHRSWPVFVGLQGIHLEIDGRMQLLGCAFGCASHSVTMDLLGHVGPRFNLGVNSKLNERDLTDGPQKKQPFSSRRQIWVVPAHWVSLGLPERPDSQVRWSQEITRNYGFFPSNMNSSCCILSSGWVTWFRPIAPVPWASHWPFVCRCGTAVSKVEHHVSLSLCV